MEQDDYVSISASSALDIVDEITVSAWVRSNGINLTEIYGRMEANSCSTIVTELSLEIMGIYVAGIGCYSSNDVAIASNAYNGN